MTQPGENVGNIYVELTPDADDFMPKAAAKVLPAAEQLGKDIAKRMVAPIADRINDAIKDGLDATADMLAAAEKTGRQIGDRVGKAIRSAIDAQLKNTFTVKVDANTTAAIKKIELLEKRIDAVGNKKVKVQVDVDDATSSLGAVAVELAALHALAKVSLSVDVGAALTEIASVESALSTLSQAQSSFPPLDMGLDETIKKMGTLQGEMTTLAQATSINVDVDTTGAVAQITALTALIGSISPSMSINVTMPDADDVGRRIGREAGNEFTRAFNAAVNAGAPPPVPGPPAGGSAPAAAAGRRNGGAYGDQFRNAVERAMHNLPTPRLIVGRQLTQDELAVNEAYRRLSRLRDLQIGVDISEREALEEMAQIEAALHGIQHQAEEGTTLEFNTRAAQESLRRFREEMNNTNPDPASLAANGRQAGNAWGRAYEAGVSAALDNIPDIEIDANTDDVTRSIQEVRFRLSQLRNQRIGIDIDAETAGAEIDRLRLELIRLGQMSPTPEVRADTQLAAVALANLQRQLLQLNAYDPTVNVDVDTGAATAALGRLTLQAVATQFAVAGIGAAGLSMVTILVPAAAAAAAAIGGIGIAAIGAVAAMGVAALALSGVIGAVQAVSAANEETGQSAGQAATRMNSMKSAADGVKNAERSLADAQKDAKRAQEDLTDARKAAREEYEDLSLSIRGNALSQVRAQDDLAKAEADYNRVKDDPAATAEDRHEANLAYEEAKLRVDELAVRAKRLGEAEEKANRVGIEGSDQVVAAKDRIAQANQRVIQATEALANAQRQQAQAAQAGAGATNSAAQKAADALAKLTPEGRAFVKFIVGLKDQLGGLRAAAEQTFLPGLQRGIEAMLPLIPAVSTLIARFGLILGKLAEDAGKALGGQFWIDFLDFIGTTGAKVFDLFARSLGNVIEGVVALVMAFGPFAEDMSEGLLGLTQSFADWAKGFGESDEFKAFMDYVKENGPKLVALLSEFAITLFKLVVAFAPLGQIVLDGILALFTWINNLSNDQLMLLVYVIGALAITLGAVTGTVGAVIAGIVAVAVALVYAYNRFEWFRKIVDTVVQAWVGYMRVMGAAIMWLWENAIQPAALAIGRAFMWLWRNVLVPAWNGILAVIQFVWPIIQVIFSAWLTWMGILGAALMFLWTDVVRPVWQFIQAIISVVWTAVQIIFGLWQVQLRYLGAVFMFLYTNFVRPAFNLVAEVISTVWNQRVKPVLTLVGDFISREVAPAFRRGVDLLIFWWEALRDGLKRPIKFVIETVINEGLLGAYRWIAGKLDLPNKDIRVPMPAGFATGGHVRGPGSGTSDSIMARLSNGEYIIPSAIVAQYGVRFFDWLIGRNRSGTQYGDLPGQMPRGFKDGGLVDWLSSTWDAVTDPVGEITKRVTGLIDQIPGGEIGKTIIGGTAKRLMNDTIGYLKNTLAGFWGGTDGPTGPGPGFPPWPSSPMAQRGDSGVWRSILNLVRMAGIPFNYGNAYRAGDPLWHGSGRAVDLMGYNQDRLAQFFMGIRPRVLELIHWTQSGRYGITRGRPAAMSTQGPLHYNHLHVAMARGGHVNVPHLLNNIHYGTFDSGGLLMPGLTYAYNGTGKPERILTDGQWDALNGSKESGGVTYNVYPQRAEFTIRDLDALTRRQDALARVGRTA